MPETARCGRPFPGPTGRGQRPLLLALVLFLPLAAVADERKPLTAETLWQIARPGPVSVSPDGRLGVFSVTRYDIEKNKAMQNLHALDLEGGETLRLTWQDDTDAQPALSPDGRWIAFVARRGNPHPQLFVMPMAGGEARRITDLPVPVSAPKWFPDSTRVAFSASVIPGYRGDFEALAETVKERLKRPVTARVTENRSYRYWDRWLTDGQYPRLFSIDLESGEITDLMPGSRRFFAMMGEPEYDISPDGEWLAVSANATEPPYEYLNFDIFMVPADGSGELVNITADNPANDLNPVFSPRGDYLVYGAQRRTDFYADTIVLTRHDRDTGARTRLAEDLDRSPQDWQFDSSGRRLYFHAQDRAAHAIFSLDVRSGRVREIHRGGNHANVRVAGDRLVFNSDGLSQPPEIFSVTTGGRGLRQLTEFNQKFTDTTAWGRVEDVAFPGANGDDVQMYIIYPPNYDESKRWPLVNLIHGGPHGIFGDNFHFRWNSQVFAAAGQVVIMPNFHGSTSFGQAFAESIHGSHADLPFRDTQNAVDWMLENRPIDPGRLAAAGGSYGGYLVSWIAGHTDRYKALVNHAGVYNLMAQFGSDGTHHRVAAYSGSPWENRDVLNQWNPAMFAENFVTPMLIIHGERDYRVPVGQGLEIYGVYKGKGLEARLVYYPDENHWILSPQNAIHWHEEVLGWLERWIGAGPSNAEARL